MTADDRTSGHLGSGGSCGGGSGSRSGGGGWDVDIAHQKVNKIQAIEFHGKVDVFAASPGGSRLLWGDAGGRGL